MGTARKEYIINDTSVILESAPDDDVPTVQIHIDKNSPLPERDLLKLKVSLLNMLIKAYNSFDLPIRHQLFDTNKSTGYQINFNGNDTHTNASPDEFFNCAVRWLDNLNDNVRTSGSFEEGLALTLHDIDLNTPQPDPDDPDERTPAWSIPSTLKKNEYVIGNVHFEIEETHTDDKYRLSFHEDMKYFPQITEISEALIKLLVTNFSLQGTQITINGDKESGGLDFIIKTDESLPTEDFLRRCDRLMKEVHINASRQKDVLKGIEECINQLDSAHAKNQTNTITKAFETSLGTLPVFPDSLKPQIPKIAAELTRAVLQPYPSVLDAIASIREGKGTGSDGSIKARLTDALVQYISAKAQLRFYVGELADALHATIPKREPIQGRGS